MLKRLLATCFLACLLPLIACIWSGSALALKTSAYSEQSQVWKEGYVYGIMESLSLLVVEDDDTQSARAASYRQCFQENEITSAEGVRIVGRFILRTPDASAYPMIGNVIRAFGETCARYFQN